MLQKSTRNTTGSWRAFPVIAYLIKLKKDSGDWWGVRVRRRDFVKAAIGLAIVQPCIATAQGAVPVIGFLSGRSLRSDRHLVAAFMQGLAETGYVEGRNVTIEFRWADDQVDQLRMLSARGHLKHGAGPRLGFWDGAGPAERRSSMGTDNIAHCKTSSWAGFVQR